MQRVKGYLKDFSEKLKHVNTYLRESVTLINNIALGLVDGRGGGREEACGGGCGGRPVQVRGCKGVWGRRPLSRPGAPMWCAPMPVGWRGT